MRHIPIQINGADFVVVNTHHKMTGLIRLLSALIMVLGGIAVTSEAVAQSCSQMNRTIRSLDRNRDYRNLNSNTQNLQNLVRDLTTVERAFIQAGCQRTLNAGQSLNRQCQTAARQIIRARRDKGTLESRIRSGQSVAAQRAQLAQRVASGNCGAQTPNFLTICSTHFRATMADRRSRSLKRNAHPTTHYALYACAKATVIIGL